MDANGLEIPAFEFDGRTFDAREVVQRYRKRWPLKELQQGLSKHHEDTRKELVELINEKYADFVSLSSRMQGVERALKPLRSPLEESGEITRNLHTKLGAILGQAQETQDALTQVHAKKDALKAYIENARIIDKAKAATNKKWGAGQESEDTIREYAAYEGVARDLQRVRLNIGGKPRSLISLAATKAPDQGRPVPTSDISGIEDTEDLETPAEASKECQSLLEEAVEFEKEFSDKLRDRLEKLLSAIKLKWSAPAQSDASPTMPSRAQLLAIAHLCRALVTLGSTTLVESVFMQVFVKECLNTATTGCTAAAEMTRRRAMNESGGGGVTMCIGVGAVDLAPFFEAVCSTLLHKTSPMLWLAGRLRVPADGSSGASTDDEDDSLLAVPSISLVANSLAIPVLRHVQQVWPNIFTPGFPDVYVINYGHAARFLRTAEAAMAPVEHRGFAHSKALADFQRGWKTHVYSQLRGKEAVQRLDNAAATARASSEADAALLDKRYSASGCGFWLEMSAEVLRILETIWSDKWYLDILFAKMMQLSLELIARYGKALQSLSQVIGSTGTSGWDASASQPTWAPTSLPMRIARIAADALQVLISVQPSGSGSDKTTDCHGSVAGLVLSRAPGGPEGRPRTLAISLLREAGAGLQPVLNTLEAALVQQVVSATNPQFASVRGIPAFYRMLNKPVPTKASPYVEAAIRPIRALREASLRIAPENVVAGWVQRAVDGAALEFSTQATQLLESTRQQEASLRRLAGRGTGGEAQVSDLDKIHIQLCLDVETFKQVAADFGASSGTGNTGLANLNEAVASVRQTYEAHKSSAS